MPLPLATRFRAGLMSAAHVLALSDSLWGETTVATASTADIGATATEGVVLTGAGTIVSFGPAANKRRFVRRPTTDTGTLTLTNGASLVLPGAVNINVQPGDSFMATSDAGGVWRIQTPITSGATVPGLDARATAIEKVVPPSQAAIPGVALAFTDSGGVVVGYQRADGSFVLTAAAVSALAADTFTLAGQVHGGAYPGIEDADADARGFVARYVRSDGAVFSRAVPASAAPFGIPGKNYAPNAIAWLSPVPDGLMGWWLFGQDATQSAQNLAVYAPGGTLVGSPEAVASRLRTTNAAYLQTSLSEPVAFFGLFACRLVEVSTGVVLSSKNTDPNVNSSASAFGLELRIVSSGPSPAGTIYAQAAWADQSAATITQLEASIAVNDVTDWRLIGVIVTATGLTLKNYTGSLQSDAQTAPTNTIRFPTSLTLRTADPAGALTGKVDHALMGLRSLAPSANEEALLVAAARAQLSALRRIIV